jgi:hypothetical protein
VNLNIRSTVVALIAAALSVSHGVAQTRTQAPTPAQLRDMIIEDSLTPAKAQLRNFVAELRDTLNAVPALHASITRNLASGTTSVVLSDGRQLGKRCRLGGAFADLTIKRIAVMHTNDPGGDQALNAYRSSLTTLIDDFRVCVHDDSTTMAAATPDPKRIESVAAAARDAVTRYDAVRDAFLRLLQITLPIRSSAHPRGM